MNRKLPPFMAIALAATATTAAAQQAADANSEGIALWVLEWAEAWQSQDVEAYLERYHPDFVSQFHDSQESWREERRARISSPASIEIVVCNFEVVFSSAESTAVRFQMDYRSPTYADSTLKEMVIAPDSNSAPRILRETNVEVTRRSADDSSGACGAAPLLLSSTASTTGNAAPAETTQPTAPVDTAPTVQTIVQTAPAAAAPAETQPMSAATTTEEEPVFYGSIHGGINDVDEWQGRVQLGKGLALDGNLTLDNRWAAGLTAGRQYGNYRFELEYQQGRYNVTNIALGKQSAAVNASGDYRALTANAYRSQQLYRRLDGYAALGIGWGEAALPQLGFTGSCQCFVAADESGFIWQWRLGLELQVNDANSLFLQYTRIMDVPGPASPAGTPSVRYEDKDISTASLGWRFKFE